MMRTFQRLALIGIVSAMALSQNAKAARSGHGGAQGDEANGSSKKDVKVDKIECKTDSGVTPAANFSYSYPRNGILKPTAVSIKTKGGTSTKVESSQGWVGYLKDKKHHILLDVTSDSGEEFSLQVLSPTEVSNGHKGTLSVSDKDGHELTTYQVTCSWFSPE